MMGYLAHISFILAVIQAGAHIGFGVRIEVKPHSYASLLPKEVNVTCITDGIEDKAKEIISLEILKEDRKPLVSMHKSSRIFTDKDLDIDIKAEGEITEDKRNSYLSATVNSVNGKYTCAVYYFDHDGFMREEKDTGYFDIGDQDVNDVLRFMMDRFERIENRMEQQEHFIKNKFQEEAERYSVFAMTTNSETNLADDDTLFLSEPIGEKGGSGYNQTTGVYTAPYNGLYVFQLSVRVGNQDCLHGQHFFNDRCYLPVRNAMQYLSARDYCKRNGNGYIAAPSTTEENEFLSSIRPLKKAEFFIGLNDLMFEGKWKREDSADLVYTNWDNGQPDDYGRKQDIAVLRPNKRWDDISHHHVRSFICATKKRESDFKVMANDRELFRVHAALNEQESGSISVNLNKGDAVKVVVAKGDGTKLIGNAHTIFSGHLVMVEK